MVEIPVIEAARRLNLTPRTVRYHCSKGHLPYRAITERFWVIPERAVATFEPDPPGRKPAENGRCSTN